MNNSLAQQIFAHFKLPPQDVAALSFCAGNRPAAVKEWAEALPAVRADQTSVMLYRALPEIGRLKTSPENRLAMLEAVRPYVQQCIQGLARHFLNQPLILPEAPMKSAVIAQALQKHMTSGYNAILSELAAKAKPSKSDRDNMALACHRAISGLGLMLLRSCQLYTQTPDKLWLELHSLYRFAEAAGFSDEAQPDPLLQWQPSASIHQAYCRVLLLACARPNQLRQTEVSATYEVLEDWARLARVRPAKGGQSDVLFVINLGADMAPLYKSRFGAAASELIRELDLSQLLSAFRQRADSRGGARLRFPNTITQALAAHLEQAWGANQQRSFERQSGSNRLEVCVGLSALHHHCAGAMDLAEFIGAAAETELDLDLSFGAASWATPGSSPRSQRDSHSLYNIPVVDKSPGGYCLEWRQQIPAQVKAGEVLGLRESGRHRWGLGVIRWIQQFGEGTRMGVQLLAPKVTPYAAALEQADGDYSDYRHALLLPELKAANQAATLLTAFAPFQENQRLRLNSFGKLSDVQLTRRVFATAAVSQFTFRNLETPAQLAKPEPTEGSASPWDS